MGSPRSIPFDENPLADDSAEVWDRLIESLSPATFLVCITERMSPRLRTHLSPEDVWQETLLHVWRDRAKFRWEGVVEFRRWVLSVALNRIRNAVDFFDAQKRGGGQTRLPLASEASGIGLPPPVSSTTPSRVASYVELAEVMREALHSLPPELRDVVRLRYFEELPVEEVAAQLELGESAVKHRYRKGAQTYHALLEQRLASRDDRPR